MFKHGRKVLAGVAALAALALGASAIATAASSGTSTSPSSRSAHPARPFNGPAPGTAAHEDAEKPVTGTDAAKAQAAAIKAAGGGTAGAVTTDLPGTGYEVTVTKADGTKVDYHLDGSFKVIPGPPPGGHGPPPPGAPGGPPPGAPGGPPPSHRG